jgi:hypothetical protein
MQPYSIPLTPQYGVDYIFVRIRQGAMYNQPSLGGYCFLPLPLMFLKQLRSGRRPIVHATMRLQLRFAFAKFHATAEDAAVSPLALSRGELLLRPDITCRWLVGEMRRGDPISPFLSLLETPASISN